MTTVTDTDAVRLAALDRVLGPAITRAAARLQARKMPNPTTVQVMGFARDGDSDGTDRHLRPA